MNRLEINKKPTKRKGDKLMDRIKKSLNNHNYIQKKSKKTKFSN